METTKQTDLQEKFLNKQNEINRLKRIYYDADEKLVLPKHPRYYYDWLSSRYNSYPMEKKPRPEIPDYTGLWFEALHSWL